MASDALIQRATLLLEKARAKQLKIATAESCTGGLIIGALTEIAGSSDVVDRGFITYSNAAKTQMLGVDAALIAAHGAVSDPVARAMAQGALERSDAQLAVAVTGIAGPSGGTAEKPVGLVHFACARRGTDMVSEHHVFSGDRAAVREQTVMLALMLLLQRIGN